MKNFLSVFIAATLSLFIISCENPTDISLFQDDSLNSKAVYSDTLALDLSTVLADSNNTASLNYVMTGNATDPVFGKVNAIAYLQPTLRNFTIPGSGSIVDTFRIDKDVVIDSINLSIIYDGFGFYGDTLSKSTFGLYRLKKSLGTGKNYNGSDLQELESNPIVKFSVTQKSFRTRGDTLKAYLLKLPQNTIAGELVAAGSASVANTIKFIDLVKGFAIVPEKDNKTVYPFRTNSGTSGIIVYWHKMGETSVRGYKFEFNGKNYSYLNFDRTGTALASLNKTNKEIKNKVTKDLTYVQSGSGIYTKVNFAKLKNLGSNLKISKATLEFEQVKDVSTIFFPKAYSYTVAEVGFNNEQKRNASNLPIYITPIGSDLSGFTSRLVDSTNLLSVDVTNFVQKLGLSGKYDASILLLPSVSTQEAGNSILANDNLRRSVFRRPKLKIYYTKN